MAQASLREAQRLLNEAKGIAKGNDILKEQLDKREKALDERQVQLDQKEAYETQRKINLDNMYEEYNSKVSALDIREAGLAEVSNLNAVQLNEISENNKALLRLGKDLAKSKAKLDEQEKRIDTKLNDIEVGKLSIKKSNENLDAREKKIQYRIINIRKFVADHPEMGINVEDL